MKKYKYIMGLDVGISSVGWGLLLLDDDNKPYKILDVGSRIFPPGETEKTGDSRAKERREKRGTRRQIRRREFRLDRVRNFLYQKGFLKASIDTDVVSDINIELTDAFNKMIQEYYLHNKTNPYQLKVDALDRKLTPDELSIILVHYAKRRGYKSNRESDSEDDSGKVKASISENKKIMEEKNYRTISEMYVKDDKFKNRIKNSPNNYKLSVTNEMYLDEINKVLDKQIEYGLIDKDFKDGYLEIYNSRRNYSQGPGYYYEITDDGNRIKKRSPYGGNLIERMTGNCVFDGKPRAPKFAPGTEEFILLSKIVNTKYKTNDGEYKSFTPDEINKIVEYAKDKKSAITYKDISKLLKIDNIIFKDLSLSKSGFIAVIKEFKKKFNIDNEPKVNINDLSDEQKKVYDELYNNKLLSQTFINMKGYHEIKDAIIKSFGKDEFDKVKDNYDILDELAKMCTNYKLNDDIYNAIKESDIVPKEYADMNFIEALPNLKDHNMLSSDIIHKLIPLLKQGLTYDKAMNKLGYNHSIIKKGEKEDLLVPISVDGNITNQRVIRSLTQTRKVINAIIKKYGLPEQINIETARELTKIKSVRNEIEKENANRREENEEIKKYIKDIKKGDPTSSDLLKYRLWNEQKNYSAYSMKKIGVEQLFDDNMVQVDHILPYHRTYDDNYSNKTLVFISENQEKRERTPYEWFGKTDKWNDFEAYINNLNISQAKKDKYLLKNLDEETERAMRNQNLNDTKYISRELSSFIKTYLNVDKVHMYPGAITDKLKGRWGLHRLTHSYMSPDLRMPKEYKPDVNKDRDNHLHHAMDALVIAAETNSLARNIAIYEQIKDILNYRQNIDIKDKKLPLFDPETGAVLSDEEVDNLVKKALQDRSRNKHLDFPKPYDNFIEEAIARVYEMDRDTLIKRLEGLDHKTYTNSDLKHIHTLTPSIAKTKFSGALHKETYYGQETIDGKSYRTIRKSLESISKKDLENMPYKDSGNKEVYNAIMNWFGDSNSGADALKKHDGKYPVMPSDKECKEIKKIKIYLEDKGNGHVVNGAIVDAGGIYQTDVYKSNDENDDKLYFVSYDLFNLGLINRIKKDSTIDFDLKLVYGQANNFINEKYSQLSKKYHKILQLNKGDLVKITNKKNKYCVGYVVGQSSGLLEIKSPIGDGYDLAGDDKLFDSDRLSNNSKIQFQITVSTIKSIEKLRINILGEIDGL